MIRVARWLLLVQQCAYLASCNSDAGHDITYSSNRKTLGEWAPQAQPPKPNPPQGSSKAPPVVDPEPPDASDDGDAGGERDSGGKTDSAGEASVDPPVAPMPAADGGSARLRFSVLTRVQHPRLKLSDPGFDDDARGPKNMGAIWVSQPDGTFVRSLEVWRKHIERKRHLVAYNDACKCPEPDVITSSTLAMHKVHEVTWDMTDRNGKSVSEGEYVLHVEVADYDVAKEDKADPNAKNALLRVDFDTRTAPRELSVADTEHYGEIELELFAP